MENSPGQNTNVSLPQKVLVTIRRFGKDLFGVILVSLGVIFLLSSLNITQGKVIDLWESVIFKWFGWGAYLLIFLFIFLGIVTVLRNLEKIPVIGYKQILFLELFIFFFSALLAAIGNNSIENAAKGFNGGIIGWGISRLFTNSFGHIVTMVVLIFLNLLLLLSATGLFKMITTAINTYFERVLSRQAFSIRITKTQVNQNSGKEDRKLSDNDPAKKIVKGMELKGNLPSLDILLNNPSAVQDESYIHAKAIQIEKTLEEFGIPARVAGYRVGPTIIQYAVEPGFIEKINDEGNIEKKKIRVSQIVRLEKDIALALSVKRIRIEAPIPGHMFVGIEIPNISSVLVRLKSILDSDDYKENYSPLNLAFGLDVSGNPIIADLTRMPHLLISGTTGAGKSVCITSLIACIAMNNSPSDLRLAILDPKMVELVRFNGLPHLLGKVETQIDRMLAVLAWGVKEMEERYKKLEEVNARDLDAYNLKMIKRGENTLPKIVIVIDELADMMLNDRDKTETYLVRLAQMARATGIHLIVATQRPSTDVITGIIKANFPARIAFMTSSPIDSRVILDVNGAETLMGKGEMLYLEPESAG